MLSLSIMSSEWVNKMNLFVVTLAIKFIFYLRFPKKFPNELKLASVASLFKKEVKKFKGH